MVEYPLVEGSGYRENFDGNPIKRGRLPRCVGDIDVDRTRKKGLIHRAPISRKQRVAATDKSREL